MLGIMNVGVLLDWIEETETELLISLSTDDEAALESDLRSLGISAWESWANENRAEAERFWRAAPAKRASYAPRERRRLTFLALHQLKLATGRILSPDAGNPERRSDIPAIVARALASAEAIVKTSRWGPPFD
jgi:hypothetical protein